MTSEELEERTRELYEAISLRHPDRRSDWMVDDRQRAGYVLISAPEDELPQARRVANNSNREDISDVFYDSEQDAIAFVVG